MSEDGRSNGDAAVGEAGAGRSPVLLVDSKRDKPAPLEPSQEAARCGKRYPDPGGDLPDPCAVVALAEHQECTPLGERELEAGVGFGEGARGEADGPHCDPFQVGRERGHDGEMPGRGVGRPFVDCHPAGMIDE